jgi:gluconate 2-dehydrogenase gamma chain
VKRRQFISIPARSLGGLLMYTLAGESFRLPKQQDGKVRVPLRFFSAVEAQVVNAACERIFPSDESGPGATEAGVVIYIDRQLAGPYGSDKYRYTKGPWIESVPEHGYQGKENPGEIYRAGIKILGQFTELPPAEQDAALRAIENSLFFRMLRTHTIEGMFCDPLHGGNIDMIGWQMIGFPGPRMSYRDEIDQFHGRAWRAKPVSLSQVVGHPVKGWEDERG